MMRRRNSPNASSRISEILPYTPEPGAQGRLGERVPVAVIDIGSNSVRQVIYEGHVRAPAVLFNEKVLCGLGEGLGRTKRLSETAIAKALATLRRFRALGRQARVSDTHILATAAVRDAENGGDFVRQAEAIFGVGIRILSGKQEAAYAAWGVRAGFHKPEGIVGDMGGGSLELVGINGEVESGLTLPLGGLRLAEESENSIGKAAKIARSALKSAAIEWPGAARNFYAVGGTWRSLFKLHIVNTRYPLNIIHDYKVSAKEMARFCNAIVESGVDKIEGIQAISRNRRSLLAYGALLMLEIMKRLDVEHVYASSLGVREGFLYSMLGEEERARDSLIEAARDLCVLRSRSPIHAIELAEFTERTFAAFGESETEDEARWRTAACLLADVGWRAHPDFRAQQNLAVISNAGFVGIDHTGRAFLALANYFRYQGLGGKVAAPDPIVQIAGPRVMERSRLLACIMRVSYLYSASMPGVLPRLRFEPRPDGSIAFVVPSDLADLCGERPDERLSGLARESGRRIELEIEP